MTAKDKNILITGASSGIGEALALYYAKKQSAYSLYLLFTGKMKDKEWNYSFRGFIMDLFDYMREQKKETESPLASRLRPTTLEEVVGQQHIVGKDKLLYRAIKADKLSSIIFYGPPGTELQYLAYHLF